MFSLISLLVFGLIAGVIAKMVFPPEEKLTMLQTSILGVVGSYVGGGINYLLSGGTFHPAGLLFSIVGAIVALYAFKQYKSKQ